MNVYFFLFFEKRANIIHFKDKIAGSREPAILSLALFLNDHFGLGASFVLEAYVAVLAAFL